MAYNVFGRIEYRVIVVSVTTLADVSLKKALTEFAIDCQSG